MLKKVKNKVRGNVTKERKENKWYLKQAGRLK